MQDNWMSKCPLQTLKQRAFLLSKIRQYFTEKNVLEVETPILSSSGNTDINIESFTSNAIHSKFYHSYLRTSAEFPLKRLLCSGVGDVYELGKVFRKGEVSTTHNVEFTMLEWYRIDYDYLQLIQDVIQLFECILSAFKLPIPKTQTFTYFEVFKQYLGIETVNISESGINELCQKHGYSGSTLTKDEGLDYLFATQIQPSFDSGCLIFLTLFPASQAALSQINSHDASTALRFEVFYQGYELGNGYQELTDAQELSKRFDQDNNHRAHNQSDEIIIDQNLLSALQQGMPECSGIAIGVDRLLMALIKSSHIKEVLTFNANNA